MPGPDGRIPRRRSGGSHGATVAIRRRFKVRGQTYNRLMYINSNRPQDFLFTDDRGTVRSASHNVFSRDNVHQTTGGELADFAMNSWEDAETAAVTLRLKRGQRVLESINPRSDGSFSFTVDLRTGVNYVLEAQLSGERIYSERISCPFRVGRIPPEHEDRLNVRIRSTHKLNTSGRRWTQVDNETFDAQIRGGIQPVLWFAGPGSVVFDTFALDVGWLSQQLGGGYHTFSHGGRRYSVELQHLCLATCTAMSLRYYGKYESEADDRVIKRVVEAAAQYVLQNARTMDIRGTGGSPLTVDTSGRDPSGNTLVRLSNGDWPHNHSVVVSRAGEQLLRGAPYGRGEHVGAAGSNLLPSGHPKLANFFGLGMPVTLADDLTGNWEHGRVCRGVVVKHDGTIAKAYVNDPSRQNHLEISTDGSQSDLGWVFLGRSMRQTEVLDFLLGGADQAPASRMHSAMYR